MQELAADQFAGFIGTEKCRQKKSRKQTMPPAGRNKNTGFIKLGAGTILFDASGRFKRRSYQDRKYRWRDQTRFLPYLFNGVNRNKTSIALNLKSPEAKKIFYKMAQKADVILEGFRPGVCKKLNIDYDAIKEINPQIIYCSRTGYGQDGPYREKPGHDINYLGYSGLLSLESDLNNYSKSRACTLQKYFTASVT